MIDYLSAFDGFILGVDTVMILAFYLGYKYRLFVRNTNPVEAKPARRLTETLGQQDFEFWFSECCRLHRLAEQAHEWKQWEHFWRLLDQWSVAQKRFQMAQKNLLKG